MKRKTFNLITSIIGGICAITSAIVAYINPNYCSGIVASITIINTALIEILSLFIKE